MTWLRDLTVLRSPRVPPNGQKIACPLCGGVDFRVIGTRGNREHTGADPNATPHLWTHAVRCTACELIFTNPMLAESEALEAAYYNDPARYEATDNGNRTTTMFASRLEMIAKWKPRGRLLDVGAGKGEFVRAAVDGGWDAEGIEPSPRFAQHASDKLGVRVHCGTLGASADTTRHAYDVITLNHVLEHVDRPRELLRVISEHLAPDGLLFVEVPNADATMVGVTDAYFRARGRDWTCRLSPVHPPFHRYAYNARAMRRVLEEAGYEIVEVRTRSGRDRGIASKLSRLQRAAISVAFRISDILPNQELLCVLARPIRS